MARRDPTDDDLIRPAWQAFLRAVDPVPHRCSVDELMRMHAAARVWIFRLERVLDGKGSAPPVWPPRYKKTPNGLALVAQGEDVPAAQVYEPPWQAQTAVMDAEACEGLTGERIGVLEAWDRFRLAAHQLWRARPLDDRELNTLFRRVRCYLNLLRDEKAQRRSKPTEGDGN